jgi:CrcB protein
MKLMLLIGAGSFLGGIFRYGLSRFIQEKMMTGFPWGTFCVNIIGCLIIGIVYALFEKNQLSVSARLFWATGICGGFTTFSAFSVETFTLMKNGQTFMAIGYIAGSICLGLLATVLGFVLIRSLGV